MFRYHYVQLLELLACLFISAADPILPDLYHNRWLQTSQTAPPSQIYHQTDRDQLAVVSRWLQPACWWLWNCCHRCSRIVHSPSRPHWSGIFAGQLVGQSGDTGWSRWSLHSAGWPSWAHQRSRRTWNWPVLSRRGSLPACSDEAHKTVQYVFTIMDLVRSCSFRISYTIS